MISIFKWFIQHFLDNMFLQVLYSLLYCWWLWVIEHIPSTSCVLLALKVVFWKKYSVQVVFREKYGWLQSGIHGKHSQREDQGYLMTQRYVQVYFDTRMVIATNKPSISPLTWNIKSSSSESALRRAWIIVHLRKYGNWQISC